MQATRAVLVEKAGTLDSQFTDLLSELGVVDEQCD